MTKSNEKKQVPPSNRDHTNERKAVAPLVQNTAGGEMPVTDQKINSKEKITSGTTSFKK